MVRDQHNLPSGSSSPADVLNLAADLIGDLGPDFQVPAARLADLRERLRAGRFHLAVLGQFKRGKSTLLNALLGQEILPTAVVPLTAIPTWIRYGSEPRATLYFQDDREPETSADARPATVNAFLSRFATEAGNPGNSLGVLRLEVAHPAPILRDSVVLIDTPGVGSTFKHNTEATLNFLPQCDAALFLVSADPPLTEVEVEFLKQARARISRLFFVLNKIDYLDAEELQVARGFLQRTLEQKVGIGPDDAILCVSARQGLAARLAGDPDRWRGSGMAALEQELIRFLAAEKSRTLAHAVAAKARETLDEVMLRLQLAVRSLRMPLHDLQRRLEVFEQSLTEVAAQRESTGDLLAGDLKRTLAYLEELAARQRTAAHAFLTDALDKALVNGVENVTDDQVQEALAGVIPGYFEHQSGAMADLVGKRLTRVLGAHQERSDQLIGGIRQTAANLFEIPYALPAAEDAFHLVQQPDWVTHRWSSTLSPIPRSVWERLLPGPLRRRLRLRRIAGRLDDLVLRNVENLRWALYQSINDSFRHFGSELDARLRETRAATKDAITAAMRQRQERGAAVDQEIKRLESAGDRIAAFISDLDKQG